MPVAEMTAQEMAKRVGTVWRSDWIVLDQTTINAFASATGDHQFIHVDSVAAAATPFGGTIAHGFLLLSLMPKLSAMSDQPRIAPMRMEVNYGGNRTRFLSPVRSGSRIRGRFTLLAMEEKRPGQWQQTTEYAVEVDGTDKPALIAEWISQIFT
ncbi:nodulation protein NodN [Sphingomonas sp. Leaf16]|nr:MULTISPECIES: MaoC family dehydratase [unclassified Sphingomonas]KQM64795.1 nodulation protein NodN [Sphingomonas sp. Leaf16]KQN16848.1 nodulation protein NodN [Sphingomonas sp. Leaf29]KQN22829.1 nodulation protein NodN [Sphingomonas sp. Leaf32]